MSIKSDYHLHSFHSGDSDTPTEEIIQQGIALGLTHLCFTQHHDMAYPFSNEETPDLFVLNTDSYLYEFLLLKEKYQNQISLCFGVELGLQEHIAPLNAAYSASYPFDFIIASSHVCNRKDPYYPSFFDYRTDQEAFSEYFESILSNIRVFSDFDVYGHLDYVVRYSPNKNKNYRYSQHADILDEILKSLIAQGKGIELNTGGFDRGLDTSNPCPDIIRRYHELGGEIITIGSDAHNPHGVGAHFDKAADILRSCHFRHYTIFQNRKAEFIKL